MTAVLLAVKPTEELAEQYGPMRTLLHHEKPTQLTVEQCDVYEWSIAAGETLRESTIDGTDGTADLIIRFVKYVDPVTQWTRYAVDYWSIKAYWATDHHVRAVAESAYVDAVRGEFAEPTLTLPGERFRFSRGLASFYDVTDVI
ncbi:hypothetical protein [Streptomyces cahuitamycinicus]|uniref:Uncharacterized protein n=1 Tax=Streptomyces cahuitamycinicus TaxID=2070367 RepID=A0A2N8TDB0_9ACTN|nr:hypothetical protein [Streptomyces cahuitamycinicus]PNG17015.1 hypothetical protein C1J00_38825 [Streptomyces cahuitamycinicus]